MQHCFRKSILRLRDERGFTLMELVVVIAIMAVVMAISLPAMNQWRMNASFKSDARDLLGALQFARIEAVKRNTFCSVLFNVDPVTNLITYTVFVDNNNNRQLEPGAPENDVVILTDTTDVAVPDPDEALPISFSDPGSGIRAAIFNGRGLPMDVVSGNSFVIGSLRLQGPTGIERRVDVSTAGRIRITLR